MEPAPNIGCFMLQMLKEITQLEATLLETFIGRINGGEMDLESVCVVFFIFTLTKHFNVKISICQTVTN